MLAFATVVMLVHCFYGYHASGGPAGVGIAVGRAVRTTLVTVVASDLLLTMAIWGANSTVRLAG